MASAGRDFADASDVETLTVGAMLEGNGDGGVSELADPYRNGKSSQRPYGDWVSLRIWGRGVGVAGVNSDTPLFAILRKLVPRGTVNAMNRERLVKAAGICEPRLHISCIF